MATWIQQANVAAPIYLKGAVDDLFRQRILLALLKDKGRIQTNVAAGDGTTNWKVKIDIPATQTYSNGNRIDFPRLIKHVGLTLGWADYISPDSMTEPDEKMLRSGGGAGQIVNKWKETLPDCIKSVTEGVGKDLWNTDLTDPNRLIGIPNAAAYTTAGLVDTDRILQPSGTYGGRSIALQANGGTWDANLAGNVAPNDALNYDWPSGSGTYRFDALSPLIVRYNGTGWGTAATGSNSAVFGVNGEMVLRQAADWQRHRGGNDGGPDIAMLDSELLTAMKNYWSAKQVYYGPHKQAERMGFEGETINFEGLMLSTDFDVPAGEGYLLNSSTMSLATYRSLLFYTEDITYVMAEKRWLFLAGSSPQLRVNPRHIVRLVSVAA